jgi:hypothetical protein
MVYLCLSNVLLIFEHDQSHVMIGRFNIHIKHKKITFLLFYYLLQIGYYTLRPPCTAQFFLSLALFVLTSEMAAGGSLSPCTASVRRANGAVCLYAHRTRGSMRIGGSNHPPKSRLDPQASVFVSTKKKTRHVGPDCSGPSMQRGGENGWRTRRYRMESPTCGPAP